MIHEHVLSFSAVAVNGQSTSQSGSWNQLTTKMQKAVRYFAELQAFDNELPVGLREPVNFSKKCNYLVELDGTTVQRSENTVLTPMTKLTYREIHRLVETTSHYKMYQNFPFLEKASVTGTREPSR